MSKTDKNIHIGWSVSEDTKTEKMLSKLPECEKFKKIRKDLERELNIAVQKIKTQHNITISINNEQEIKVVFFIDLNTVL